MARTGRRPGDSGAREAILAAARERFAEVGFEGATIRGLARDAGVDPALVHHYFGTKDELFVAAMALPYNPAALVGSVLDEGVEGFGDRLVRSLLVAWDEHAGLQPMLGLVRSAAGNEQVAEMVRGFLTGTLVPVLADRGRGPDAVLRANLIVAQVVGLVMVRYVVRLEPMASAGHDEIAELVGPVLDRYLVAEVEPLDGAIQRT